MSTRTSGLEPAAYAATTSDVEASMVSTAISLKRIADAIDGNPQKLGLVDSLYHAITQAISDANRR